MKHFAKIENSVVIKIISLDDKNCNFLDFPASETVGREYIHSLGLEGDWFETSINNTFRQRYAFIGGSYNSKLNCFINPQPYSSWIIDETGEWKSPIAYPEDAGLHDVYTWNEDLREWEFQFHVE